MIIVLKTTGGMGVTYSARMDTNTLPEPVREKASQFFSKSHLSQIQHSNHASDNMAAAQSSDSVTYELTRESDAATFTFSESQLSHDELEMLDELKSHMTLMKK